MKNTTEPWMVEGVPWRSEAAYWSWVRGVLRKGWSRHPVKLEFIKKHRHRVSNPNPEGRIDTVWGMTCSCCKKDFPLSMPKKTRDKLRERYGLEVVLIEINHKNAASSLRCKEDLEGFAGRLLYVNFDDLEPLCKPCHDIYSYVEKEGVTFEEAKAQKQAIQIIKDKEDKVWLEAKGIEPASSQKSRRGQIVEALLKEEVN